jgi:phage major head subunit gpT-like protein
MIINTGALRTLYTGFSTAFQGGLGQAAPQYMRVAMTVPSTTGQNEYGWLGQFPRIREWIGERVINTLQAYNYVVRNKPWEMTVSVLRDDLEDDNVGIYTPMFTEMGRATAAFPDELLWPLLNNGFSSLCYDGQFFFDSDHPVLDANGVPQNVSNTGGGGGTPWFLLDMSRVMKPLIYQTRRSFEMVRMDAATDEVVFNRKEYRYGVEGRANAGYGFWQLAYGSRQTLDATAYAAARAAMMGMKGDYGRPLGIMPNLLVVPPALEAAGRAIIEAERNAAGATNVWRNTAELLVVPWLS